MIANRDKGVSSIAKGKWFNSIKLHPFIEQKCFSISVKVGQKTPHAALKTVLIGSGSQKVRKKELVRIWKVKGHTIHTGEFKDRVTEHVLSHV